MPPALVPVAINFVKATLADAPTVTKLAPVIDKIVYSTPAVKAVDATVAGAVNAVNAVAFRPFQPLSTALLTV